jgi:hypothetical protein
MTTIGGSSAFTVPISGMEVGEHLEEVRLERLVGAVELVDQQDRRPDEVALERLEDRAADEELLGEDVLFQPLARLHALGLGEPDLDHLARVVPLVHGARDVETLVALQAHQLAPEGAGQHLCDLGLADAGLALEEERLLHAQREEHGGGEAALGHVVGPGEEGGGVVYRLRERLRHGADGGGNEAEIT